MSPAVDLRADQGLLRWAALWLGAARTRASGGRTAPSATAEPRRWMNSRREGREAGQIEELHLNMAPVKRRAQIAREAKTCLATLSSSAHGSSGRHPACRRAGHPARRIGRRPITLGRSRSSLRAARCPPFYGGPGGRRYDASVHTFCAWGAKHCISFRVIHEALGFGVRLELAQDGGRCRPDGIRLRRDARCPPGSRVLRLFHIEEVVVFALGVGVEVNFIGADRRVEISGELAPTAPRQPRLPTQPSVPRKLMLGVPGTQVMITPLGLTIAHVVGTN